MIELIIVTLYIINKNVSPVTLSYEYNSGM